MLPLPPQPPGPPGSAPGGVPPGMGGPPGMSPPVALGGSGPVGLPPGADPSQFPSLDPGATASLLSPQMMQDQQAFAQSQMQAAIAGAMMATNQPSPDQLAAQGQPAMGAPTQAM